MEKERRPERGTQGKERKKEYLDTSEFLTEWMHRIDTTETGMGRLMLTEKSDTTTEQEA